MLIKDLRFKHYQPIDAQIQRRLLKVGDAQDEYSEALQDASSALEDLKDALETIEEIEDERAEADYLAFKRSWRGGKK
jgi:predicted ribosome quality control (RQC) complex YloA/Tae2 family protein